MDKKCKYSISTINSILEESGFKPLSQYSEIRFYLQYCKYNFEDITKERIERASTTLEVLEILKGDKVRISSNNRHGIKSTDIEDDGLLKVMASGLKEYADSLKKEAEWAVGEKAVEEASGEYCLKKNQLIGVLANYLLQYGKEDGIFNLDGKGITKEYSVVYDILESIGIIKGQRFNNMLNSQKYKIILDAIKSANQKHNRGKDEPDEYILARKMFSIDEIWEEAKWEVWEEMNKNESINES